MLRRCTYQKHPAYKNYGGRGISVCESWSLTKTGYKSFVSDMGLRPAGCELDRIDNNGNYSKDNCRWVTRASNAQNRRTSRFITFRGETKTLSQWARDSGLRVDTLFLRLKRGFPIEKALLPVGALDTFSQQHIIDHMKERKQA